MTILKKINEEINDYNTGVVYLSGSVPYSAYKLLRRIGFFKNQYYPTGKYDSQGNYKYWFDVISPRADSEIKSIDFDTKDIALQSDPIEDSGKLLIANARLRDFLRETGQAAKLNEAVERGTEWGNVIWKKQKKGYSVLELEKVMVLNQTAETLEDSDVIECEIFTPIDMRKKKDVWYTEATQKLIDLGQKEQGKTSPEFYIYERNGEVTTKEYYEAKGKNTGDEHTYILAKVIVGGTQKDNPTEVLFCEEITEKPYKEYHRGKYSGRWLRVGMYEILFDVETRCNEIGNDIARGLEWASKTIFRYSDKIIAQNILTDLQNGDAVRSADLSQVEVRMQGFDQLIADWNRMMTIADRIANSYEVVQGITPASGTPLGTSQLLNQNANKLFDFIREKLSIAFQDVFEDWILPDLLKDLKSMDVLKLTEDSGQLARYYEMIVDSWYVGNLLSLPPHTAEMGQVIKESKLQELLKNKEVSVKLQREMWEGFKPRAFVVIAGENVNLGAELQTLQGFITLEADPVRRTALIEMAMKKSNIDVSKLPKSPPMQPIQQPQPMQQMVGNQQPVT